MRLSCRTSRQWRCVWSGRRQTAPPCQLGRKRHQSGRCCIEKFGKLDILVNNAARIMSKLVIDMTREDWESIMSVNVTGAFLHSREAMKAMIPNKSGPSLALVPSRFSSRQNA
jgi:NAD(P)-dependent dehydrogenase (short-subunit alcohol dehydrogenase family)